MQPTCAPHSAQSPPDVLTQPQKDETPGWQAEGFWGQEQVHNADCQCTATEAQADEKRFATLRARLGSRSWMLSRSHAADGNVVYAATRWNMARELANLDAVAAFADMVGAPA